MVIIYYLVPILIRNDLSHGDITSYGRCRGDLCASCLEKNTKLADLIASRTAKVSRPCDAVGTGGRVEKEAVHGAVCGARYGQWFAID